MKPPRGSCVTLGLVLIVLTVTAAAQGTYPVKPIKLIAPFPPGGGTDIFARLVATNLNQTLGWTIVVENKPGAAGSIGVEAAARSAPDGYTLVLGQTSNLAINPALYSKLAYDPLKDLMPVALVASTPLVLVASPKSTFKSLSEMVTAAKAKPDAISIASPGNGTVGHLTGEMFMRAAGIKLLHVPYKGASPALTDILGGQVDVYFATAQSVAEHIKAGTLRALGTTSAKRLSVLPNVPTIAESGYKDFEAVSWYGLLVPAGTPESIVARLNSEINKVLQTGAVRTSAAKEGSDLLGGSRAQFAAFLESEQAKWSKAVKESGAKVD
ncbi:MAG TPA: tripartite tricarboxylate transporter substrate binding protein [Casimicrobiaceae bacterium]|nr:tripartite tricarboxylate transporter substrate binding protein [Casimicrobiaceae bacterium]